MPQEGWYAIKRPKKTFITIIHKCVQTNDDYQIEIFAWNHVNISIRLEYLKPYIPAVG